MKPAVLFLHGHYLGGWAWEEVARDLAGAGWQVASPTLPGCGREEEAEAARVGLQEHVGFASTALVELAQTAPGSPLVVVAHSYSGLILQTLLGHPAVAGRITAALFLDAVLCQPGECLLDVLQRVFPGIRAALASQRVQQPPQGFVRPPALDPGSESVSACRRYAEHCGPAPWGSFTDPLASTAVPITQAVAAPRVYVRCEKFPLSETIWQQVRGRPGWREEVWPVWHLPMLSDPGRVTEWIHRIVREDLPAVG